MAKAKIDMLPNVLHCHTTLVAHMLCVRDGTPEDEILDWIRREDPTNWVMNEDVEPEQCPDYPDRKHVVVNC
jgi:hypothetical protein